ncbi:MAG: YcaO-like family protein [Candidatus Nanopelagicales bacterium]
MEPGRERKRVLRGTHRTRAPEDTWELVRPLLRDLGISRVADVTWLDDLGIPVFQAIHPRGRSFAVSQGKGLTRDLARVSAVMEGIEGLAAERPPVALRSATAVELTLDYDVGNLALPGHAGTARRARLDWCDARDLLGGGTSYVPAPVVSLDWTVHARWAPRLFPSTSDGLASGNTYAEAALHGLLELVERHAVAVSPGIRVDMTAPLPPDAVALARLVAAAGGVVDVWFHPHPSRLPVFSALLRDDRHPVPYGGSGCHLDPQVALCRAITEAAQSRATVIAGSRDDLGPAVYRWRRARPLAAAPGTPDRRVSVGNVLTAATVTASDDVATDLHRVLGALGPDHPHVLATDLSVADGVHVVKVVVPTLSLPAGH